MKQVAGHKPTRNQEYSHQVFSVNGATRPFVVCLCGWGAAGRHRVGKYWLTASCADHGPKGEGYAGQWPGLGSVTTVQVPPSLSRRRRKLQSHSGRCCKVTRCCCLQPTHEGHLNLSLWPPLGSLPKVKESGLHRHLRFLHVSGEIRATALTPTSLPRHAAVVLVLVLGASHGRPAGIWGAA